MHAYGNRYPYKSEPVGNIRQIDVYQLSSAFQRAMSRHPESMDRELASSPRPLNEDVVRLRFWSNASSVQRKRSNQDP